GEYVNRARRRAFQSRRNNRPIGPDGRRDKSRRRRDDSPAAIREVKKIQTQRLAAVLEQLGQASVLLRADDVAKARREAKRPYVLIRVFKNSSQVLMGDGEIAIDLRDQHRIEFFVPSDDGDAKQKRENHQRGQQSDGEEAE